MAAPLIATYSCRSSSAVISEERRAAVEEEVREAVERYFADWNTHDIDRILPHYPGGTFTLASGADVVLWEAFAAAQRALHEEAGSGGAGDDELVDSSTARGRKTRFYDAAGRTGSTGPVERV